MANPRAIPDALDPAETLAIEQRWLPKAGILAIVAGLLPLIGTVLQILVQQGVPNDVERVTTVTQAISAYAAGEQGEGLIGVQSQIADHFGHNILPIVVATALIGLSAILIAPVIYGLLRSAWRRRPSFPRWFFWMPIVGGLVFGIGTTVAMVYGGIKLAEFADLAPALQTNSAAVDALSARRDDLGALSVVVMLGQLFLAVGIGAAALSAMNVGLLTKLMGYLGVMLAVFVLLPLDQQGFLRAFWFIALGVVLLGRTRTGRPPAWESGKPEPWPTRAELIEAAERAREEQQRQQAQEDDAPAPKPKASSGSRKRRK